MPELAETQVNCPYCAESIWVLIDDSIEEQEYIEDCQVCCRPIVFKIHCHPGAPFRIEVRHEDDV